jgi:hypothetical protein
VQFIVYTPADNAASRMNFARLTAHLTKAA